eukprot:scaffold52907_cov21-Tisochrysis_lutea.AAC.1
MQALRALRTPLTRETRGLIRKDVQQKRFMSGDDEPGVHRWCMPFRAPWCMGKNPAKTLS